MIFWNNRPTRKYKYYAYRFAKVIIKTAVGQYVLLGPL